ncbi:glycine zipper 2TM domain-containing protein [Yanghanlia caeni]|uniref:Glycine zipper 2TM domain-containing protein n=1 Tax=Yanghanlia caeni TaxID=3064283 RepID=A0ABU1D9C1_9BURK|nr:glycine zipper 2TM domain-containing protein [Alcaligenaceae bacterium LG-2]NGR07967.1 glycine zipper 2TM domain-containing protein [bacterium SGD-2]HZH56787.1 glycine zipper 2TM domain-containing protein [Burkholderiaceae bacterium]
MKTRSTSKAALVIAMISLGALAACQSPSGSSQSRNAEFNCIAGTVGGAVIGGLLGSTIGGGRGRTAATAVGIGAGGYIGNAMGCK